MSLKFYVILKTSAPVSLYWNKGGERALSPRGSGTCRGGILYCQKVWCNLRGKSPRKIDGDSTRRVGLMEMIHRITQQIRLKTKLCFLLPSLFYAKKNAFVKLKKRVKMLSYWVVSVVLYKLNKANVKRCELFIWLHINVRAWEQYIFWVLHCRAGCWDLPLSISSPLGVFTRCSCALNKRLKLKNIYFRFKMIKFGKPVTWARV